MLTAVSVALAALPTSAHATDPVLVIDGRGWGHGVGMSQEGARTMGAGGSTTDEILDTFYPGTVRGTDRGTVRVVVLESGGRAQTLGFPDGGALLAQPSGDQAPGFPIAVAPGGSVEVLYDELGLQVLRKQGRDVASAGVLLPTRLISNESAPATVATLPVPATTTTAVAPVTTTRLPAVGPVAAGPTTTTTAPAPADPPVTAPQIATASPATGPAPIRTERLWAVPSADGATAVFARGRRYRGAIEVAAGPVGIELINHVDVEAYLRGMGEVLDPSWPPAALRAQAVAARTYALRASDYDLCDDDRCQVYIGQGAEYPAMDRAVADSRGQVLRYDGTLAATFYSANGGGVSATPEEGFGPGGGSYPYLKSSPYRTADPGPWTESVRLADLGARLAYAGHVSGVEVTGRGPSGRATEVTLQGDAGPSQVDGRTFAFRLGLKSTLFTLRAMVGLPATPAASPSHQGQDPGALMPSRSAGLHLAVPLAAGKRPRPWAERHAPALLLALSLDLALIGHRTSVRSRRRRDASGQDVTLHVRGRPGSPSVPRAFPPGR